MPKHIGKDVQRIWNKLLVSVPRPLSLVPCPLISRCMEDHRQQRQLTVPFYPNPSFAPLRWFFHFGHFRPLTRLQFTEPLFNFGQNFFGRDIAAQDKESVVGRIEAAVVVIESSLVIRSKSLRQPMIGLR